MQDQSLATEEKEKKSNKEHKEKKEEKGSSLRVLRVGVTHLDPADEELRVRQVLSTHPSPLYPTHSPSLNLNPI